MPKSRVGNLASLAYPRLCIAYQSLFSVELVEVSLSLFVIRAEAVVATQWAFAVYVRQPRLVKIRRIVFKRSCRKGLL